MSAAANAGIRANMEKRALLALTFHAVGWGGEVKFQQYLYWVWHLNSLLETIELRYVCSQLIHKSTAAQTETWKNGHCWFSHFMQLVGAEK
jgi:hypothetical protein